MHLFIKEDDVIIFEGIIAELELFKLKLNNENQINTVNTQIETYKKIQKQLIPIKDEEVLKMLQKYSD